MPYKKFEEYNIQVTDDVKDRYRNIIKDLGENTERDGLLKRIFGSKNKKKKFKYLISDWGADLQSEHERYLVEKHFNCPVILYDYPAKIKAFYMRLNDDEKTVAAITFDGWATDARIAEYTEKLKDLLAKNNIAYTGNFSYLGYNPPYEVVNRRNEVVVDVEL